MSQLPFPSAMEAIRWAEETGTRPICDTLFARLLKRGGHGLTPMEIRDLALSITNLAEGFDPPFGKLYKSVYGEHSHGSLETLGELVAEEVYRRKLNNGKTPRQVTRLAAAVIESHRVRYRFDRGLSRAKMARIVGITKQSFSAQPWTELEADVRCIIAGWLSMADKGLTQAFKERKWVE